MKHFGLVGYPLGHSFSKNYFSEFFLRENICDCTYENFAIENIKLIKQVISDPELCGFNVTIPYKQHIIPYLDCLSPEAEAIGAVNCVKIQDGKLKGHNTDCYGFHVSLLDLIGDSRPSALVLGSGGASKAVRYVLKQLGIACTLVSRTPDAGSIGYDSVDENTMRRHCLIVNTTPLGMHPKTDTAPQIPYRYIGKEHFLYDLVYNPARTLFLENGMRNGAKTMNGEKMLHLQAQKSWEIWNSETE